MHKKSNRKSSEKSINKNEESVNILQNTGLIQCNDQQNMDVLSDCIKSITDASKMSPVEQVKMIETLDPKKKVIKFFQPKDAFTFLDAILRFFKVHFKVGNIIYVVEDTTDNLSLKTNPQENDAIKVLGSIRYFCMDLNALLEEHSSTSGKYRVITDETTLANVLSQVIIDKNDNKLSFNTIRQYISTKRKAE